MLSNIFHELAILSRLARLRMTIFSAVTYSVAYTIGMGCTSSSYLAEKHAKTNVMQFLIGWAFVLCCQTSAHLLGEYYDLAADRLCRHNSPFTGGSRVLVNGEYNPQRCHVLGWISAAIAVTLLTCLLPARLFFLGVAIVVLSTQYSGFPLRLNHRALGELSAALVMNVLLPFFGCLLGASSTSVPVPLSLCTKALLMLIIPSCIIKFALFLVLNLADMPSDAAAGKITLPVLIGETRARELYVHSMEIAYLGAVVAYLLSASSASFTSLILVLATAYPAYSLCNSLLQKGQPIHSVVLDCLKHAPLPVVAVFLHCFAKEIVSARSLLHPFTLEFQIRCLPIYPYVYSVLSSLITSRVNTK